MVKSRERKPAHPQAATRSIECNLICAFAVPERRHAEGDRPIGGILPDRRIAVVHELIAVVFELLSKVIQHRPCFMTSRTSQAIFSGECRKGMGAAGKGENKKCGEQQSRTRPSGRSHWGPPCLTTSTTDFSVVPKRAVRCVARRNGRCQQSVINLS